MSRRIVIYLLSIILCPLSIQAKDTVYVSGGLQHGGLFEFQPVMYKSNSFADLSVHYRNDSNKVHFRELRVTTRLELTQWPLPGYEDGFAGHGVGLLSAEAVFDKVSVTVGDVYGQFGSGFVLNLHEDRYLGIDGPLRGAKIAFTPYKGLSFTLLGGKQRRYWECYNDRAWGWNYGHDAALAADAELHIEQWSRRMQELDMSLSVGGSYVSKYEASDTIITLVDNKPYLYNLPRWVGAGEVRVQWQMKGWNVLAEYARKANDPTIENSMSYRDGEALMLSAAYSRKGLSVLAQMKRSENMSFRSQRKRIGISGRLNHMPMFAKQHTYALAALHSYATQYVKGEWAFQTEIRYTWPRKTRMGGRYGTTLALSASHIRGVEEEGSWAIDKRPEGEYYTDVNVELNKKLSKQWSLNAMLMYQSYNKTVCEGEGGMIRSGIAVIDAQVHASKNVSVRSELQYLYTPHDEGQFVMALCELSLYRHWTISGQWMYNIGFAPNATHEHYYTALLTYSHGAHRVMAGYTKTKEGFNCSGGVCRYVPQQEGVCLSYDFTW